MDHLWDRPDVTIQQLLVAGDHVFATWNPSDKNASITLANANTTATMPSGSGVGAVRATVGKSAGKWYWEVTVDLVDVNAIGVGNTSATLSGYVGSDANGWGYGSFDGNKQTGGVGTAYGATYTTGDIISVALDMDAGTLVFYKNGASQGTAFTGLTGTLYPMISLLAGGAADQMTANFGASTFAYTPPAGHNAL